MPGLFRRLKTDVPQKLADDDPRLLAEIAWMEQQIAQAEKEVQAIYLACARQLFERVDIHSDPPLRVALFRWVYGAAQGSMHLNFEQLKAARRGISPFWQGNP